MTFPVLVLTPKVLLVLYSFFGRDNFWHGA